MDAAPTVAEFFAAWDLFRAPALTGALAGMMLGCLGVYVVLRRMVFLAATVSQAASFGVALAYLTGSEARSARWRPRSVRSSSLLSPSM